MIGGGCERGESQRLSRLSRPRCSRTAEVKATRVGACALASARSLETAVSLHCQATRSARAPQNTKETRALLKRALNKTRHFYIYFNLTVLITHTHGSNNRL